MIVTDKSWTTELIKEIVEYEYPSRSLGPEQERIAVECLNYSGVKGLKKYLDKVLGPARNVGLVADLPTART